MNRMSAKLLSLSRIESIQEIDGAVIYIGPTVQKVTRMLSGIAEENRVTITLDLEEDCPIFAAEDDLYQITFNLMENGIKYNTSGGTLTVTLSREGGNAVMRITDTGMGIPKDAIEHIFERFYRVDKARSRKSGGSGLGLAIVHSMIKRNGGDIQLSSTLGKSSEFTVTFPVYEQEEGK